MTYFLQYSCVIIDSLYPLILSNFQKHLPPIGEKYLGRDTIRHFVDTYHDASNKIYAVSDLPEKMYSEVKVPPSLGACGEMSKNIVEVNIWWSGGGSASVIHKVICRPVTVCIYTWLRGKAVGHMRSRKVFLSNEQRNFSVVYTAALVAHS